MSKGWEIKAFPDCLEKSPKATKIPKRLFKSQGKYPVVSQEKGLINGYWDDKHDVVHVDQPFVVFGDHTRVIKLVDFSFVVGADGVKLLKPKPFLDPWYFYCNSSWLPLISTFLSSSTNDTRRICIWCSLNFFLSGWFKYSIICFSSKS